MKRSLAVLVALFAPALALGLGLADIHTMLDTKKPAAEIVTAVNASTDAWTAKDVYALVDRKAPTDVIKAVATKAAVFYDGTNLVALDDQFKKIASTLPAERKPLAEEADFTAFFAWYEQVSKDTAAIKLRAGPRPTAPTAGELPVAFDKRLRAWDEKLTADIAPSDGKINVTTFDLGLKFMPGKFDGACYAPATVTIDLSAISFQQWRAAMGGTTKTTWPVALDRKSNITAMHFTSEGGQKFEFTSAKLCPYEYAAELGGRGAKLKMELKRTHKGEDWKATGSAVDSRSGEKIDPG